MDSRKQAVSIRMSASDVRKIKRLAERLGVRDSDVIRFAVRTMLNSLGPLHDPMIRGRSLVPVFLDCGQELFTHFDLDAVRLDSIINDGVEPEARVEPADIQLLAMSGTRQPYLRFSLERRTGKGMARAEGNGAATNGESEPTPNGGTHEDPERERVAVSMRAYLFEKYLYGSGGTA